METGVQSSQKVDWCNGITIILSIMIKHVLTSVDVDINFLKVTPSYY